MDAITLLAGALILVGVANLGMLYMIVRMAKELKELAKKDGVR